MPNHTWVARSRTDPRAWAAFPTEGLATDWAKGFDWCNPKPVYVVCTVAHVHDESPENCADDNLMFLCQLCHLRLDAPRKAARAREKKASRGPGPSRA